jgi:probable rRNA maturation factor
MTRRPGVSSPVPLAALARAAARALAAADARRPASLAIVLSDDRELAELNERHMGKEGATDVLSFPMLEPGPDGQHGFALPPGQRVHLGDVVVSVERATAQASEGRGGQTGDVRWTPARELRLLVVHGVLHVCGWDHAEPVEEKAMRTLEQAILGSTR